MLMGTLMKLNAVKKLIDSLLRQQRSNSKTAIEVHLSAKQLHTARTIMEGLYML